MIKVTAIFDIGKSNKKLVLFDRELKEVYRDYIQFEEIRDEDGDLCDDLTSIQKWIQSSIDKIIKSNKFCIEEINFSTYGASLVHIDKNGNVLTPLYNYTKNIEQSYIDNLYEKHGGVRKLSSETASPPSGMLNSGIQMYWLKYQQPDVYSKIEYSLHFPQYLSYLFTGQPISDYTSLGCHTMLWDYSKSRYHTWVLDEEIDKKLAPIVGTDTTCTIDYNGHKIKIGVGIHDSSAALLPYLINDSEPFILISTGTWNVTLNPFYKKTISQNDLELERLNYMSINGKGVRASRIFLGNEYKLQVDKLNAHFDKQTSDHKNVRFDRSIYRHIRLENRNHFHFSSLEYDRIEPKEINFSNFPSFEYAYHQLMHELVDIQVQISNLTIGDAIIKKVYIDGGFIDNELFIKLISYQYEKYRVYTAKSPIGSAIGAALMMNHKTKDLLIEQFNLKEHKTLILDV